jgi:hypothetical protein
VYIEYRPEESMYYPKHDGKYLFTMFCKEKYPTDTSAKNSIKLYLEQKFNYKVVKTKLWYN